MKAWLGLLIGVLALCILFLAYLLVGGYNVAASRPHALWVSRLADFAVERSVRREGLKQRGPRFFNEIRARQGARPYQELCAACHGAPGSPPSEMGRGMNPLPSDLRIAAGRWTREEIFWITKNGLKLRGMPGFGATRDDKTLWQVATFVKSKLPDIDSAAYAALAFPAGTRDTSGCAIEATATPVKRRRP